MTNKRILRVKSLRILQGMSQQKLADAVGVRKNTVSLWECGYLVPSDAMQKKLCEVLEVSFAELWGFNTDPISTTDLLQKYDVTCLQGALYEACVMVCQLQGTGDPFSLASRLIHKIEKQMVIDSTKEQVKQDERK